MPRAINSNLLSRMSEGGTSLCILCRVKDKSGGTMLAVTSHAEDVTAYVEGANILFRARPGLFGSKTAADLTLNIDNSEVGAYLVSGVINISQLYGNRIDGARYELYICDYEFPTSTHAPYCYDRGFIGEVPISDTAFKVGLRSLAQPLHQPIGMILQPGCRAGRVGETNTCNFPMAGTRRQGSLHRFRIGSADGSSFATVQTVADSVTFAATAAAGAGFTSQPDVWFDGGVLKWITSANGNGGLEAEIRSYDWDSANLRMIFQLQDAMGGAIVTGDTFTVDAGCNHTAQHCYHKFRTDDVAGFANGNMHNYQGEPHLTDESELVQMADRWVRVTFLVPDTPIESL
jgi:uncharacterized phage protein (TIGR02218 family)